MGRRLGMLLALVAGAAAGWFLLAPGPAGTPPGPVRAPERAEAPEPEAPGPTAQPDADVAPKPRAEAEPDRAEQLRRKGYAALRADRLDEAIRAFVDYLLLKPGDEKIRKLAGRLAKRRKVEADYELYESGRFTVKYAPEAKDLVIRGLSDHLEAAWSDVGQTLGHYPEGTLGVVVYADREEYQRATGAPGWMVALFDGRVRIPVDPGRTTGDALQRIVYHEMTHFVLRDLGGRKVPQWLHEGLAQHFAGEEGERHWETYRLFAANGTYIPIRSIEDSFAVFDRETVNRAYHQSLSIARYIIEAHGTGGLERLLGAYAAGQATPQAFPAALDLSLDEFQRQWFEELKERWGPE